MVEKIMEDLNLIPFNLNNEHNFCSFSLHNLQKKYFHKELDTLYLWGNEIHILDKQESTWTSLQWTVSV